MLLYGDEIEIGECGINILGGQKQCLNIVCVIYFDVDVVFMDDFLSVVDVYVGRYIFDNVIFGLLKDKCCIFVIY